jgi:hypothetical protein
MPGYSCDVFQISPEGRYSPSAGNNASAQVPRSLRRRAPARGLPQRDKYRFYGRLGLILDFLIT